jgi:hypothetical protein
VARLHRPDGAERLVLVPKNVFWQVAALADIGMTAHFESRSRVTESSSPLFRRAALPSGRDSRYFGLAPRSRTVRA